jgi:hypothetical protein
LGWLWEETIMFSHTLLEECIEKLWLIGKVNADVHATDSNLSNIGMGLSLGAQHTLPIYWLSDSASNSDILEKDQYRELTQSGSERVIACAYLPARQATRYRELGIQYMDATGNAYISQPDCHIVITGQRASNTRKSPASAEVNPTNSITGKAFQPTGLKVIFALLTIPGLASASLRKVSQQADVSLGSVSSVYQDLIAQGYYRKMGRELIVQERDKLIRRWAEAYPYAIRNKQHLGTYTTETPEWWKKMTSIAGVQLGGEIGASLLCHYLNPKNGTVYATAEAFAEMMTAGRFRKLKQGEQPVTIVDVYQPFWEPELDNAIAPELVIFSDLLVTGNPRNQDAAERLYDERLC